MRTHQKSGHPKASWMQEFDRLAQALGAHPGRLEWQRADFFYFEGKTPSFAAESIYGAKRERDYPHPKSPERYCIWMGARRRYFDSLEEAKRVANQIHKRSGVIVGIESAPARGSKRDPQKSVTVYAATIWWRDSDPLMTVVAKTAAKAKALAFKAMKEEAKQAYDSDQFDKLYQAQDALAWSGVHVFNLSTLVSDHREYDEALSDLKTRGYAYLSGH
jgi:hypothetical protein